MVVTVCLARLDSAQRHSRSFNLLWPDGPGRVPLRDRPNIWKKISSIGCHGWSTNSQSLLCRRKAAVPPNGTVIITMDQIVAWVDNLFPEQVPAPSVLQHVAQYLAKRCSPPQWPYRVQYIDLSDPQLFLALIVTLLHPVVWNVIGRFEYYTRVLSKVFVKPRIGVSALALWILLGGFYRNALVMAVMRDQETVEALGEPVYRVIGALCCVCGAVLVMSSFYQLGFVGTFLGDYFGILMEAKVTAFPFNVLEDPMYDGSTMLFAGKAIL